MGQTTPTAAALREAMDRAGVGVRELARRVHYNHAYVSRVLHGRQQPSTDFLRLVDTELGTTLAPTTPVPPASDPGDDIGSEVAHLHDTIRHLVALDGRYGGDAIAATAVQVWRTAHRQLDRVATEGPDGRAYLAAVAELAELAGWLLFDANRQDEARVASLEAHMLARHAGDTSMRRFALTNLAMQDLEAGRVGESLRIADELLEELRLPPRVALLARVRRGRALAHAGDRPRALAAIGTAMADLGDSITDRDPAWTWWVDETEVTGHEGESLLLLGDASAALERLLRAEEMSSRRRTDGRGTLYYRISVARAYRKARAWRECEDALLAALPLMDVISSGRNRRRFHETLREIRRDREAPTWLRDTAVDIAGDLG
ncbi:helix-turn-helix domain-containing protein [Marinitenerispora sediminis]|uniref:XRE family transcriptional regulator n=1 Tax=Marinitenerispora sediminis TaxID=1931232 RepID=A0A368SYK8_9ACTN|nr:helix-turn-helix transcriptional regulator [Marinitenerispora sediminis]RCV47707.1 XRE family transcriptional regulator [Marinitenerispora sediminis]RCV49488.1 XRE family transcriptional regulator [Marinitenerispora sediminis]RCV49677.1 XRE family transcriptional regulator [Marinitenerispora sediminis]